MEKEYFVQLPYPYSNCRYENLESLNYESYNSHLRLYNVEYSTNDCLTYCFNEYLREHCQHNVSESECIDNLSETEWYTITNEICIANCPVRCTTIEFKRELSYLTFPTDTYFKDNAFPSLNASDDLNSLKERVLRLGISFKKTTEKVVSKKAKFNPADLVSQIGGFLGVFLGASFISLFEMG